MSISYLFSQLVRASKYKATQHSPGVYVVGEGGVRGQW